MVICFTYGDSITKKSVKIYNFENGEFFKYINNKSSIYFLLSWYNKKNEEYYIIQISYGRILINNLNNDDVYAELKQEPEDINYDGFIFNKNDIDYLCCSLNNGYIHIWNLYDKKIFKIIYINKSRFMGMVPWNEKYFCVSDLENKSLKVIDVKQNKVISNFKVNNNKVSTLKKCLHPIYGESLLILTKDGIIKLLNVKN